MAANKRVKPQKRLPSKIQSPKERQLAAVRKYKPGAKKQK